MSKGIVQKQYFKFVCFAYFAALSLLCSFFGTVRAADICDDPSKFTVYFEVQDPISGKGISSVPVNSEVLLYFRTNSPKDCSKYFDRNFAEYISETGAGTFVSLGQAGDSKDSLPGNSIQVEYWKRWNIAGLLNPDTRKPVQSGGRVQFTAIAKLNDGTVKKPTSISLAVTQAVTVPSASEASGAGNVQINQPGGNQNPGGTAADSGSEQARLEYAGGLKDPVSYKTLGDLISGVIKFLLGFIGALAVLFIVVGGIRMITAAGNETQLTAGKKTLSWAVIGLLVALLGYTLIGIVQRSI